MFPILPARSATFSMERRTTKAGVAVWRATCSVMGCPSHVEGADRPLVLVDAHEHRAAHVRGARRLVTVTAATIWRAA